MRQIAPQNPTRAMTIAITGGAAVATAMMFVPVGVLEGLIGPTGVSELVPAAGAPLGDLARALIAYAMGAATLGGLTVVLLSHDAGDFALPQRREAAATSLGHYRAEILQYLSTKMPWRAENDDIRSLSDLSRFRSVNVPADEPGRRPLIASQDLPDLGFVQPPPTIVATSTEQPVVEVNTPAEIAEPNTPLADIPLDGLAAISAPEPSTAFMVAQLETAVAVRLQKRALLESGPVRDIAQPADESANEDAVHHMHDVVPIEGRRPVLELVASAAVRDDDADSALAAALATLHRMTATAR